MKKIKLDNIDVFLSDDLKDEEEKLRSEFDDLSLSAEEIIEERIGRLIWETLSSDMADYLRAMQRANKAKKFGVLHAHGNSVHDPDNKGRSTWIYADGNKTKKIQDWIDKYDGKYFCLVLFSCNPGSLTVSAKNHFY